MDWRWAVACVQWAGRGHIVSSRAQLVNRTMLSVSAAIAVVMCLSVSLSVISRYCIKMEKDITKLFLVLVAL